MMDWNCPNVPFRICAIDPGTDNLGIAVVELDMENWIISVVYVDTFKSNMSNAVNPRTEEVHGGRLAKHQFHRNNLYRILMDYCPHAVIAEAPFLKRFVTAFEALVECRTAIRYAVMDYNSMLQLEMVDPASVKAAVGAKNTKDKDVIKIALKECKDVYWKNGFSVDPLDEHSVDAVAVGVYKARQIMSAYRY